MLQQIRKLEEFTAAEGNFTQDVDLEQDAKLLPDFLAGERVTALVTGTVRASVDFSQLDEDAIEVSDDGTTIRLTLPEPQLGDADIEESSARIIGRDRGLIDRVDDFFADNPTDDAALYAAAEEKVAAAARESDLVEEARTNTEAVADDVPGRCRVRERRDHLAGLTSLSNVAPRGTHRPTSAADRHARRQLPIDESDPPCPSTR